MADLNQCTSRTLASKASISTQLASRIVGLRKQKGRIRSFSELWDADGMTRPIMKQLTSELVIKDESFLEAKNLSNNNKRTSKRRKCSGKSNVKRDPIEKNQRSATRTSRFLESLPLLADSELSETSPENSFMKIYTPMAVKLTPSGEKIVTVYQVASPDKIQSLKSKGKPQQPENFSDNHPELSKRHHQQREKNYHPYPSRFTQNLSPTKKHSIEQWIKSANTSSSRRSLHKSKSRSGRCDRSKYNILNVSRETSLSRSRSRSPLLRKSKECVSKSRQLTERAKSRTPGRMKKSHSRSKQNKEKERTNNTQLTSPEKRLPTEAPFDVSADIEKDVPPVRNSSRRVINSATRELRSLSSEKGAEMVNDTLTVDKQMTELTKSRGVFDRRNSARRSLWKDSRRRHHRHHHHHRRSRDKNRPHEVKDETNSKGPTESCIIL